jgi:methylenetetrahydrofolate dehydrogenase (NADP+)/methenyltetrahydrofolate cyclohydrolase
VATRIDGGAFLDGVVARLRREIAAAGDPPVCIATVLVSDDPRDLSNARRKHVRAREAGMRYRHCQLPADASQRRVEDAIAELAADTSVHGIFVQLPLPKHLDGWAIVDRIPVGKDIDGLSCGSLARLVRGVPHHAPATPRGILRLLQTHGVGIRASRAVIVGRSVEIARALGLALVNEGADVTIVDPGAPGLAAITSAADILVSAAERPGAITAAHVKAGAAVVDAGYNRTAAGVVGDVEAAVGCVASVIVPMPGGIGPATIACLLESTWLAARAP